MSAGQEQAFAASWDSMTKVISAVVTVLLFSPAFAVHFAWIPMVAAVILLAAYAWSPQSYQIRDGALIVKRLAGNVRITLSTVRQVRPAGGDDLGGCVRLFGSGGLFGWYGLFRTTKLGKSIWYMTNRQNAVVLIADGKTILVSPDDVERFVNAIRLNAPQTASNDAILNALGTYEGGNPIGAIIAGVVGAIALALMMWAWLYSPGPPKYTLTPTALVIHDRFYPVTLGAQSVDLARVRVVDLATDKDWQPTMRTNGFANTHYRAGWFRVANGAKVRMYRASGTQLVLLPPAGNGNPVLLETTDPERFVAEVKQEWAGKS